jgi:hypothetical protein
MPHQKLGGTQWPCSDSSTAPNLVSPSDGTVRRGGIISPRPSGSPHAIPGAHLHIDALEQLYDLLKESSLLWHADKQAALQDGDGDF